MPEVDAQQIWEDDWLRIIRYNRTHPGAPITTPNEWIAYLKKKGILRENVSVRPSQDGTS